MSIKRAIKRVLPSRLSAYVGGILVRRREEYLAGLPLSQAFDEVYKRGMWKQGDSLSGVGSEGRLAERYVNFVRHYAVQHNLRTVVDAGAGDFSVGSKLAPAFERYLALDVSPHIIGVNRKRYVDQRWAHVTFDVADMTVMAFPSADLVLIRQVMQHLTNAQIELALKNLEASSWRRVLITDEVFLPAGNESPNIDLPSHSVRTRANLGSGVFIDKPPFNRHANRVAEIYDTADGSAAETGLLVQELVRNS